MNTSIVALTDSNFATEVEQAGGLVLVDFWAEWCAPCRALSKVIDEVASDSAGTLKVGKMNIDENRTVPARFAIASIPTVMLFKGGAMVDQVIGLVNKGRLQELIAKHR